MSLFDGKPIGRIEFGPKIRPVERVPHSFSWGQTCSECGATCDEIVDNLAPKSCPGKVVPKAKQDEYWKAIRATAEGTNITTPVTTED